MTLYALLLQACGLSQREAAEFHGVRLDTVKSWSSGRNHAPSTVLDELRGLRGVVEKIAREATESILARVRPGVVIELGYPTDDVEARALGLPCVGAWRAMASLVVVALDDWIVLLVPRGSTPATAAAMEAHGH